MENNLTIMECLILLKSAYPKMTFSQQSVKVYQLALADIDPQLLRAAVLQHIAVCKWFPTIAELRQAVTEQILAAEGQLTAPEAWGVVMREVARAGHWGQPDLAPLIRQAVQAIGGWRAVCFSQNIAADRARFLEAYTTLQQREAEKIQQIPAVSKAQNALSAEQERISQQINKLFAKKNGRPPDSNTAA